jgi:DNA-binding NtrC family response regulator
MLGIVLCLAEHHAHGEGSYTMTRILIIDDNASIRDILRQALERAGHEVVEASDGRVGIEYQRTLPAEVIITDILMPEQEGFKTIRELQRDFPTTGIIAMSGGGQIGCDTLLAVAERLGAQRVLQKPFGLRDMLDAVHQLLQRQT